MIRGSFTVPAHYGRSERWLARVTVAWPTFSGTEGLAPSDGAGAALFLATACGTPLADMDVVFRAWCIGALRRTA